MFKLRKHRDHGVSVSSEHEDIRERLEWESSNGRKTLLKDIDKNHLNNIINKIKRGEFGSERTKLLKNLRDEQIYRINNKED